MSETVVVVPDSTEEPQDEAVAVAAGEAIATSENAADDAEQAAEQANLAESVALDAMNRANDAEQAADTAAVMAQGAASESAETRQMVMEIRSLLETLVEAVQREPEPEPAPPSPPESDPEPKTRHWLAKPVSIKR